MDNIGSNLNTYGRRYSQQTIEDGKKFYNFIKKANQDAYDKKQKEIAKGTNIFLNFIKKVRADVLRQSIERRYAFIQPRRVPEVIDLTTDSDSPSLTQSQSQSQSQPQPQLQPKPQSQSQNFNTSDAIQHTQNNQQAQVYTYKLNRILNGKQVQYLDNSSRDLLVVLNKGTPKIIANQSEKKHVVSNNELKALVTIAFCKKFNIKSSNVKELQKKVIDFDNNHDGKKINRATAKNYCIVINELINKNTGRHFNIYDARLSESKLNKMDNFVLNELKVLDKLKNTDNKE